MPADGLTWDGAIALSDAELEERLWDWVGEIEDDDIFGNVGLLIDELTERHAPHIALMSLERMPETMREGALEWMREREGARLIRRALESD